MTRTAIQIDTQAEPDCAVVWLHGLGATGHDFEPIVEQLNLPKSMRARFIFPHAPMRAVTINNGAHMPAWYDIYGLDIDSEEDAEGIQATTTTIHSLIERQVEQEGIRARRIVLAGFSQGGALALYAGLRYQHPLAGLLGLSCYLPLHRQLQGYAARGAQPPPILLAHGNLDEVIPLAFAQLARKLLELRGFQVCWREYPCAHTVCPQEIADIRTWLLKCWR